MKVFIQLDKATDRYEGRIYLPENDGDLALLKANVWPELQLPQAGFLQIGETIQFGADSFLLRAW